MSIAPLCGDLRLANSLPEYLDSYSWTETDLVVASNLGPTTIAHRVHLMALGELSLLMSGSLIVMTEKQNTERELTVSPTCPSLYKPLATDLSADLGRAGQPPYVMDATPSFTTPLLETTSGNPLALRSVFPPSETSTDGKLPIVIGLFLPVVSNLAAWFRAFLTEVHESDPTRVPQAPPRLSQPSDWYTPEERALAVRISEIDSEIIHLNSEKDRIQVQQAAEGEKADSGIRQAIWADGNALVSAVKALCSSIGFLVRDMDAELNKGDPKREDLRLTLQDHPEWEAIVEVKGYPNGTKTNDGQQIRTHRERYIKEQGRYPNLTLWLANEHRTKDPSSRPPPIPQVVEAAELVGAVHVLSTDLYRQWSLVAAGKLDKELVIKSLVDASPGLWNPPVANTTG